MTEDDADPPHRTDINGAESAPAPRLPGPMPPRSTRAQLPAAGPLTPTSRGGAGVAALVAVALAAGLVGGGAGAASPTSSTTPLRSPTAPAH